MKKNYILSLGMMFAGTFCMTANTDFSKAPFIMPNTPAAAEVTAQVPLEVVFSEDFSKFTAGTEAAPDATDIGGDDNNGYVIDSKYVSVPGTYGKGVHQAGGVCALKIYEYTYPGYPDVYKSGGYISTPEAPLFGDVEISFRAKKISANGNLWVGLCDNVNGPVDTRDYVLTDEWKAFTFKSDKGTFTDNNVVQFSAQNESEILLDDIVIKRAVTKTEPPMADYPINKSFTEFVARWTKTKTAEKYRLNVYKKVESADYVKGTLKENFDNIKVKEDGVTIDTANPNYPEGWTVNVSEAGKQDMNNAEGFYGSAPQSLVLDEVGDTVITPETPAFINEIRFWVRPSSMAYEDNPSMIGVCVWDSKIEKWIAIANLPNYYFREDGMVYTFNSDQIGLNVNKVKFDYIQKGSGEIAFCIDDIELDYETQLVDEPVLVNYETTDTFCVVNNIDPTHEHYYYVQAIQGSLVSEKTSDMWVNAITGLKPVIDAPKNVTGTGFDITWTKFWNAREYSVELSKIVKAADDMKGVVVLEENFDKIKDGTVDNPGMDWGASYDFAENGMCDTHWVAYQAQWAAGMAGTRGTNVWTGTPGFIASPKIDLDCNGGAFDVELTVVTLNADDEIAVMIQPDLTQNATQVKTVKCTGAAGSYTGTVHFDNGGMKGVHISVMSMTGKAVFIDKIKVTQDLKKGEMVSAPYKSYQTDVNEYSFADLPGGCDYGVQVTARSMKEYIYYTSEKSDLVVVPTYAAGVETAVAVNQAVYAVAGAVRVEGAGENTSVLIFNLQGQLVKSETVSGSADIAADAGMYIVKAGEMVKKVVVK